ncbi:hypothetical protein M9Y10_034886 [Tritrichomonas musculus]|uniref:Uncharacterized protein n=1 Tax=Tritrichomonas musculus TaxID=1915356 RepID=A0ABR2KG70_9EUKA
MEFSPTKKITISVDKKNTASSNFYLIYDNNFKSQALFQRPENHFIKLLLFFSFSSDGQYIIGDFGIPELSFPGITSSYYFYIYACFSATDSTKSKNNIQKIVHSEVYKISTAESAHILLPVVPYFCDMNELDKFSQIPVECIFSIVPFVFPYFEPKLRLLPTMLFSFVNLIPQIPQHHSIWPIISWFRQMQYSNDASVYDLYNIIFPDKEIDFSAICQGIKEQKRTQKYSNIQNNANLLADILYSSPPITDTSIDKPGLTHSQLRLIVSKIARLISLELGFSYYLFTMEPQYDIEIKENVELLVFCPTFGIKGTILTEILCNGKIYFLHSVVREEEGNIASIVYSPFTKILYDIRNGQLFPINRYAPPIFNLNEQYIMLLYVDQNINSFLSQKIDPISPFFPKYPIVNVYECAIGQPIPPTATNAESAILDYDEKHVYFAYDPDILPFPSTPLEEVCGKSVLQFEISNFMKSPTFLIWHAKQRENDQNNIINKCDIFFVPVCYSIDDGTDIVDDNPNLTFAVIQDHTIATIFRSKEGEEYYNSKIKQAIPMSNTVCFDKEVTNYSNNGLLTKFLRISFTKNEKSDKYIFFVGTPILLLIDESSSFDSIISDLKSLYDISHSYISQKSVWVEITNNDDFYNITEKLENIHLLIQLK